MDRKRLVRGLVATVLGTGALLGLAACGQNVNVGSDAYDCVYDTHNGNKLTDQIPPSSNQKNVGYNKLVVALPASGRFYSATTDSAARDGLAPQYYDTGFAASADAKSTTGVQMQIQGKDGFRFDLTKACAWYSRYGHRDADSTGDLQFNAQGSAQDGAGWFIFLKQYFAADTAKAVSEVLPNYGWQDLAFNRNITHPGTSGMVPARTAFGADVGARLTVDLDADLGDTYFCGQQDLTRCEPLTFTVLGNPVPSDSTLLTSLQTVQNTQAQIQASQQQAQLQQQSQQTQIDAANAQVAILNAQAAQADAQAKKDEAKCLLLAGKGLDCDGHFPTYVISGGAAPTPAK